MLIASYLLFVIGVLGAFDVFYFHMKTTRLLDREEARPEAFAHVARSFLYSAQMFLVGNFELHGRFVFVAIALYVLDVVVAFWDVWMEPVTRKPQGGLPRGEYFMHIFLTCLVGAYLNQVVRSILAWSSAPTAIVHSTEPIHWVIRLGLNGMAVSLLMMAAYDLAVLFSLSARLKARLPRAKPLHVAVLLQGNLTDVWQFTQDHRTHPSWDHRFSRIQLLAERIGAGVEMVYEKDLGPLTIKGGGRYKLFKPMRQSTFEFWSESPLSLIERGIGLWLYREVRPGVIEFRTSYTYSVRWGIVGELMDRLVFRPLFQWETEKSFTRLGLLLGTLSPVVGRCGSKPRVAHLFERAAA